MARTATIKGPGRACWCRHWAGTQAACGALAR